MLYVVLWKEVKNVDEQGKHFNLMTLLVGLPKLIKLWLDGFSLKFLSAGIASGLPNLYLTCGIL